MKKITSLFIVIVVLSLAVLAHGEETFAEAEEIIISKTSCNQLSENQLESLGDYYMEQMHPGELHEVMDERMGGEGSESLKQAHIIMAKSFYCGEHGMMNSGIMNMMMNRDGAGMMNSGMMGSLGFYPFSGFTGFHSIVTIGLVILVIWLLLERAKKR